MKNKETIYYSDELNDEFSGTSIEKREVDENFKYKKSFVWEFCSVIIQNIISMPVKYLYAKIKFRQKFVGKEKLNQCKKSGYFIYGNHTQNFLDTFLHSLAIYPKRNFLLVNPENISLKGTGTFVEMLGAIPIPTKTSGFRNFFNQIKHRYKKRSGITIYPEAHIWPYYTKIRNFKDVSFKYPIELNAPCFAITNTYQKRKNGKPQIISYVDGPFFPDSTLGYAKDRQRELRNRIYNTMCDRAKNRNFEVINYLRKD